MTPKVPSTDRPDSNETSAAEDASEKNTAKETANNRKPDSASATAKDQQASDFDYSGASYPIVAVGASAGGLEALQELFEHMPPDSGMGFVVISHQHAGHISLLPELLGKRTAMPVVQATDGVRVEPNRVYVSPPGGHMAMLDGKLQFMAPKAPEDLRLPIDYFFRSLAQDRQEQAICIVLSGTGSDGTMGVREVKGAGGMAMAQELKSAKYPGMPSSAMMTNMVDFILPPAKMPAELLRYVQGFPSKFSAQESAAEEKPPLPLEKIFILLRSKTGHDFAGYKTNTMRRRIERRMNVHQIKDANHYLRYLHENPHELDVLFKELLINVTSFFRDPDAFEALGKMLEKRITDAKPDENYALRVWVAGCGSGEEAYSIAILLRECMERLKIRCNVQLFATDLDHEAIDIARLGTFPEGIAVDVSPERLERFFQREDNAYRIAKEIREMVVFAPQNLLHDPPFTKLDLLSCRNVLIYFNAELQKKLLPIFHYALKPDSLLFLGPSESISSAGDLFEPADKRWKIFRRKEKQNVQAVLNFSSRQMKNPPSTTESTNEEPHIAIHTNTLIERTLLKKYAPASVIVNDRGEIVYIHGRTGYYLEPASGQARMNVLDMAREGLRLELSAALRQAALKNTEIAYPGVRVRTNGDFTVIDLSVVKITEPEPIRGLFLVSFLPVAAQQPAAEKKASEPPSREERSRIRELETELQHTKETLQTTVEKLETANEELKSTNEELTTVNAELQSKVEDLSQSNDDMQNLLNSTEIATLFLDNKLNIKRFTKQAKKLVHLIDSDIGRPIGDLVNELQYGKLVADAEAVLQTLVFKELEVQTTGGDWCLMRIMPYRTAENMIDGLVVTFIDINRLKKAEGIYAEECSKRDSLTSHSRTAVYSRAATPDYHPTFIGHKIAELTGFTPEELLEQPNLWLDHIHRKDKPEFFAKLQALPESERQVLVYRFARKDGEYVRLRDQMMLVRDEYGEALEIVGSIMDARVLDRDK